jgi:hypothetical protein
MKLVARGLEGQMFFDGHNVTIQRRGLIPFLTHGSGGTKTIQLRSVTAVQHRRCGFFHGYLQLSVAGELDRTNSGQNESMSKDENAIVFYFVANRQFQEMAETLRQSISELAAGEPSSFIARNTAAQTAAAGNQVAAASTGAVSSVPSIAPMASGSVFEQIEQLARLRDAGHIDVSDFDTKKRELLARV